MVETSERFLKLLDVRTELEMAKTNLKVSLDNVDYLTELLEAAKAVAAAPASAENAAAASAQVAAAVEAARKEAREEALAEARALMAVEITAARAEATAEAEAAAAERLVAKVEAAKAEAEAAAMEEAEEMIRAAVEAAKAEAAAEAEAATAAAVAAAVASAKAEVREAPTSTSAAAAAETEAEAAYRRRKAQLNADALATAAREEAAARQSLIDRQAAAVAAAVAKAQGAALAPAALRFYAESKRVSNALAKAELGWRPAYPTYREGLAVAEKALGDQHPRTFEIRDNLAHVLLDSGRIDDSLKLLEQSVEIGRRTRDPGDPVLLRSMNDLGQNIIRKGDTARAMPLIAEAERGMVMRNGLDDPATLDFMTSHASLLEAQGKLVDAIAKYQEVLTRREKLLPEGDIKVLLAFTNLGRTLTKAKRFAEAETLLLQAEALAAAKRNPTSDARWLVTNQLLDTSTTWLAADPKAPVAARIPAAKAKVEELRAARTAAQPPLPVAWQRG
jgi:chemotaxis protein histidine kinase CheA